MKRFAIKTKLKRLFQSNSRQFFPFKDNICEFDEINVKMPTPSNTPTPSANRLAALAASRPRIKIQIPPPNPQGNYFDARSPFLSTAHSNQTGNGAPQWPTTPYVNPFATDKESMNAGEFMFKQFGGIKDFTWDWTISGLNKGEKSVFYLYEKISRWSRKWFTHIFLITTMFLYSVAGAYIFVAVEGKPKCIHHRLLFYKYKWYVISGEWFH